MLFQSDGFANGGSPILVKEGALPLEPSDMQIAVVAGVPLWVDEEQYLQAEEPQFVLDVAAGPAERGARAQERTPDHARVLSRSLRFSRTAGQSSSITL